MTTQRFLPWVRRGLGAAMTAGPDGRPELPLELRVNARPVAVRLRSYGPGDVTGIDPRVIVRTDPPAGSTAAEANDLALVEFDPPDFPWLLSPESPDARGRLAPWLCLVVVDPRSDAAVAARPGSPLPVLTVPSGAEATELPDLRESWAWAHAQVTLGDDDELDTTLTGAAERSVSRLLCPRRLDAATEYIACLVPAFAAGRQAGLGERVTGPGGAPAWRHDGTDAVTLPVYHRWRFVTGAAGDFESLAKALRGGPPPAQVGARRMVVEDLGFGLPDLEPLTQQGALTVPHLPGQEEPEIAGAFADAMTDLVNLPAEQRDDPTSDPVVAPPVYGQWQAAQLTVPEPGGTPAWLRELNIDPRHRVAAGLGTLVVQDQQEQLMASAWQQLADGDRLAKIRCRVELAREVLGAFHRKRLLPMGEAALLQFTAPLQARVLLEQATVRQHVHETVLPDAVVTAAFRRVARPHGPVARRVAPARTQRPTAVRQMVRALALTPGVIFHRQPPATEVTGAVLAEHVATVEKRVVILQAGGAATAEAAGRYLGAARALLTYSGHVPRLPETETGPVVDLPKIKADLIDRLAPTATVTDRAAGRIARPPDVERADDNPAELYLTVPQYQQAMVEPLRSLSDDHVLPGVDHIDDDTVTLLQTNHAFVAAYLVGLNHELGRELLWREFPSERRTTYFRRFWPVLDPAVAPAPVPPVHTWGPTDDLGDNVGAAEQMVLLIRGRVLRRYPDAIIYAARADGPTELTDTERYPVFRGRIGEDVAYLGFDLTVDEVRSGTDAGWFFVVQEQVTAPAFGLDVPGDDATPATWDDLSWGHVDVAGGHLRVATAPTVDDDGGVTWGRNGAHMAAILRQRPARVALHADILLDGVDP
jgi:hypothetical protein